MIKQELQAVAEGVAASVLQSSTPSNADLSSHGRSESPSSSQQNVEFESINAGKDPKDKFEVLNSLTQTTAAAMQVVWDQFLVSFLCQSC